MIEQLAGVYTILSPGKDGCPLVVEAPRSGREYPGDYLPDCSFADLHATVSTHVEEVYAGTPSAGGTLMWANFPSNYVDANRPIDDIDPDLLDAVWPTRLHPTEKSLKFGIGLIHKWGRGNTPIYARKLPVAEVKHRIDGYYLPYHERLAGIIADNAGRWKKSWHLSCHRMNAIAAETARDRGSVRKDICLGNKYGWDDDKTYCDDDFLHAVKASFEGEGFSVSINTPFPGMESIRRHGDPAKGRNSIQVEMVMDLFTDPKTLVKRADFRELQDRVTKVVRSIADYVRSQI